VDNDGDPREVGVLRQDPVYGHGTHVAGIVALTAPEARIMPIRILDRNGEGELWRVAAAIIWAANHGADVINISFAYPNEPRLLKNLLHNCDVPPPGTQLFPELNGNKLIVVAGAGNGGDSDPLYPAGTRIDPQLSIGASTRLDKLAVFSTMSTRDDRSIRAVAPGEDVISTMPGGRYGLWSGTSMSAPIGAGVAAILHAQFPALAPHEIVDRIVENGFDWDCRNFVVRPYEWRTSRVDALCAMNGVPCEGGPSACSLQ
jgi:subtilisin family serine protease